MSEHYPARTMLRRGQVMHFRACRGMMIVPRQGRVIIQPAPLWIGEQLVPETFSLEEGEVHAVHSPGMLAIQAQCDAEICIHTEARLMHLLAWLLPALAARLRRVAALRTGLL